MEAAAKGVFGTGQGQGEAGSGQGVSGAGEGEPSQHVWQREGQSERPKEKGA